MYETLWRQLIDYLDTRFASAAERGPDEVTVALADSSAEPRTVSIVMTPLQWDHYVSIPWGEFQAAAESVARALAELPSGTGYLVYDAYELHPSPERAYRPADDAPQPATGESSISGHWVVKDDTGKIVDRFADHS